MQSFLHERAAVIEEYIQRAQPPHTSIPLHYRSQLPGPNRPFVFFPHSPFPSPPTLAQPHRPLFLRHPGKCLFIPPGREAAKVSARLCIVALCKALLAAEAELLVLLLALVVDSVARVAGSGSGVFDSVVEGDVEHVCLVCEIRSCALTFYCKGQ